MITKNEGNAQVARYAERLYVSECDGYWHVIQIHGVMSLRLIKGQMTASNLQMSVMSDNGLVGKVMDVNPTSARVALLSNADNTLVRVAAMIQNEKEPIYGTITGYDDKTNMLVMEPNSSNARYQSWG